MNSVRDLSINKKSNSLPKFLVGAVALLFLLFIINIFNAPLKNTFYAISSPFQKTFWTAGEMSSSFIGSFFKVGSLTKENEILKSQNQQLLSQIASLQSINNGNKAQSDVSLSCQNTGFKFVMAGVTGLGDNDILSINKGSANGIAVGMPVISQQNVLFGKVFKVYKNYSEIMLITNKNSVVNVKIQQIDSKLAEIDGVVKGTGGLSAYLDLIPISSVINPQDNLLTSAIDKSFPKDLLVGKIVKNIKNDQKPFQQAQISLYFDVKTTDNLFVITNYKQAK